jgi:hypothetical protein
VFSAWNGVNSSGVQQSIGQDFVTLRQWLRALNAFGNGLSGLRKREQLQR